MKKHRKLSPLPKEQKPFNIALAGLVTLLVARPFVPEDPGGQADYGVAFVLLWLLLAVVWIALQWRANRSIGRPDAVECLMAALVGWHTIAAIVAFVEGSPRPAVTMLWDWVGMGLAFVLARRIISTGSAARGTIGAMVGLAVGLSLVAIEQRFVSIPHDRQAFQQVRQNPVQLYELTGQWLPPDSTEFTRFESRLNSQQPSATFALTNSLAGFLVPWSLIVASLLVDGQFKTTGGWGRCGAGVLAVSATAVALALTGSRTALLSGAAGVSLIGGWRAIQTHRKRLVFGMVAAVAMVAVCSLILLGISGIGRGDVSAATRSLAFRAEYWQATLRMIADRPLFGWGPGQFQDSYTLYKLPTASEEIQDPHNWLLEITATAGIPAGLLLIATLSLIIWLILRTQLIEKQAWDLGANSSWESLIGAACGFVLGSALALSNGFSTSPQQMVLIAIGIGASWWAFRPWMRSGKLDAIALLVALVALLLNLTAAGGINYPSVAESLWLLGAIGVGPTKIAAASPANNNSIHQLVIRSALIVACVALLIAAYVTSYLPVTNCRTLLARADMAVLSGVPKNPPSAVESAAAADPWAQNAARRVVASRLAEYQEAPSSEGYASVAHAVDRMLDLSPRKFSAWQYASEVAETLFRLTEDPQQLDSAIEYQRAAIELFPTNSQLRFRMAQLQLVAGNPSAAAAAAHEALRLDEYMRSAGHADRQFSLTEVEKLREIAGEHGTFDAEKPQPVQ